VHGAIHGRGEDSAPAQKGMTNPLCGNGPTAAPAVRLLAATERDNFDLSGSTCQNSRNDVAV
jgi:hypothetical protein